mgnify:CR=1 FL=1|jgi:8-oxo-dGTP pyrophosphatase MutT (NUDIX family)
MSKEIKTTAAGIIVFRNKNNNPELLGLIALPKHRKRSKGRYDVPKGRIDEGETPIQAAMRECFEESSLTPKIIIKKPLSYGPLTLWLGEADVDDDVICNKNPYTGELEHEGYEWLTIREMKNNCLNYLRPFIIDAEKEIWKYFKIWSD